MRRADTGVADVYRVTVYDGEGPRPYEWQYGQLREARRLARRMARVGHGDHALVVERGVWMTAGCRRRWETVEMWSYA